VVDDRAAFQVACQAVNLETIFPFSRSCDDLTPNSYSVEVSRSIRFHGFVFISSKSFERSQSLVLTHVQVRFGYLMRFSSSNSHAGTATLTARRLSPCRWARPGRRRWRR
jgi:hypothetical protein